MSETVIDEGLKIEDMKDQVISYIEDKIPAYSHWLREDLKAFVDFLYGFGQLLLRFSEDGKINGVLGFQLIDSPEELFSFKNKRNSEGVAIVLLASENEMTRKELVKEAILISGIRSWVCYYRDRLEKMTVMPWVFAERMAA